jgi:AraC-like DNA-binding protein
MRYWRLQPDPRLRPLLLCYFVVEPNEAPELDFQGEELLIPDGHAEIVFNPAAGYERWAVGEGERRDVMKHSYLIGGRSHSVLTRNLSQVRIAGVKLDPRFLRHVIATPLVEFSEGTLTLADLNDRALLELEDAVACAGSPQAIFRLFDRFFLDALHGLRLGEAAIDRLLDRVRATRGGLSIMEWTREQRIDSRHLERRFCDAVGMTPKRYARVIRFKHSYHRLIAGRPAAIAQQLDGYYDQSHFNKEFKHFIGVAPGVRLGGKMSQGTSVCDHLLQGEFAR